MHHSWPETLWVVRHGQSAGNVARDAAEAAGLPVIDLQYRDIDTPLSDLGRAQSRALGRWFATLPVAQRPQVVLCSPYVRALDTARLLVESLDGLDAHAQLRQDERLREKEFGMLDRLTRHGITLRHPELAEQRAHVGKFYFRPPGGESWCDVILRLRSLTEMVTREYEARRVLIVAHQVVVNCMRYLIEGLDERQILDVDARADVPNCAITSYRLDPQQRRLTPELVNFMAPLEEAGVPATAAPDTPAAPKP